MSNFQNDSSDFSSLALHELQNKLKGLEERITDINAKMVMLEARVTKLGNIIVKLNEVAFREGALLEEIRVLVKQLVEVYSHPDTAEIYFDKKRLH